MGPMVDDTVKVVRDIQQSLLEVSVDVLFLILKVPCGVTTSVPEN